jgi:hypothetical protein
MPIVVACACGKQFKARDEDAGKRGRCPGCGQPVAIPSANPGRSPHPLATGRSFSARQEAPSMMISLTGKHVALLAFAILLPATVLFIKFGPLKARDDWNRISDQATGDINDVINLALRSEMSQAGIRPFAGRMPGVTSMGFMEIGIMMSVPESVGFAGACTSGRFKGTYHTRTGEVEAEIEGWGPKQKITGRVKDHVATAEIGGKPAVMRPMPPKPIDD